MNQPLRKNWVIRQIKLNEGCCKVWTMAMMMLIRDPRRCSNLFWQTWAVPQCSWMVSAIHMISPSVVFSGSWFLPCSVSTKVQKPMFASRQGKCSTHLPDFPHYVLLIYWRVSLTSRNTSPILADYIDWFSYIPQIISDIQDQCFLSPTSVCVK